MSDKEINLQALLSLDEQIQRELGAMESNISQLPQDGISRNVYGDYMARFNRIRSLFDRTSELFRDVTLEQSTPDLYEILSAKERINRSYSIFNRMLGRFTHQYDIEREEGGIGERAFAPSAAPAPEEEPSPDNEAEGMADDGPSDEEIEATLAEEEAAEAEAAEKKAKAAKRAKQERSVQAERDAIEQARAQRESELQCREDQRRTEEYRRADDQRLEDDRRMQDRRMEDDRLIQDRARDAMLASELNRAKYDQPPDPERFYPDHPAYDTPPSYENVDRGLDRYPDDHRYERPAEYDRTHTDRYPSYPRQDRHYDRAPEYDRPSVSDPPRYGEQDRFYTSRPEPPRNEPQHPDRDAYREASRYRDRPYETPKYDNKPYETPKYPAYDTPRHIAPDYPTDRPLDEYGRPQAPRSAADKYTQELREADERAREASRRDEIRRERDERFARYRDRQQGGGFTREEQQFAHFDYSAREGASGRREQGHSEYKTYDFRDNPSYTAHEYAPGGTTERPMTVGSTPRSDPQRFYSAPAPGTKSVTPEYMEQHRNEMLHAQRAYEQVRGTPEARSAEQRYQQIRSAYENTCKQLHSGQLEMSRPSGPVSVHTVDFQNRPQEPPRHAESYHTSTQYSYRPNGGISGTGIAATGPNGSVSYYNHDKNAAPVTPSRFDNGPRFRSHPSDHVQETARSNFTRDNGHPASYRNVLRDRSIPSPIPSGPRHYHINTAKSDPNLTRPSQIPGHFGKSHAASPLSGQNYRIPGVNTAGTAGKGGSGHVKDGSAGGNGPRKAKVEETSTDIFNRKSRIRTDNIAKHYLMKMEGILESRSTMMLAGASRKFYQMMQSGDDNALRTLEQGRYYGTTSVKLVNAYIHRKPVNVSRTIRVSDRRELRQFGRFATMGKKQLTREIHESLKSNRQLKNEIRELLAKGSSLSAAERVTLVEKTALLSKNNIEPRQMHAFRNMQTLHAREIKVNQQIEAAKTGRKVTEKTVSKAMTADYKAREAAIKKKFGGSNKFGPLNSSTNRSLRREIQQQTELGRQLKAEIKRLKAIQASGGRLSAAQAKKLQELLSRRDINNQYLRQLHGLKKAREELNVSQKVFQGKMTRLAKNRAAFTGGLYALYGLIIRPIQEGSETGAQGLVKFANVASNQYVHRFIKHVLSSTGKALKWTAHITHLDRTRLYKGVAKTGKQVKAGVDAAKAAPRKVVQATGRAVKKGTVWTYEKVTPQKVKTGVSSAYDRYKKTKNSIIAAKESAKRWASNTWAGRAYSAVNRALGKVGQAISSVWNVLKAVAGKLLIFLLILMIIFQIITMLIGNSGSVSGSIILSPYEGPAGKLDLGPYSDILDDEWDAYMDSMQKIGDDGGFYRTVIDMDVNPDNVREILSMMAVRFGQDIDLDTNPQVKEYLRDLLRASHPYWTETETITCDNIDTCSNKVRCSANGSQSNSCTHGHWVSHTRHYTVTVTDPETGETSTVDRSYTYHTWSCEGHCGGHPQITFHVNTLGFDAIFGVDPHGAPTSSSATVSNGESRGNYTITYYCNEKYPHICNAGPPYKTATGAEPTPGRTIAVDPHDIPLGTHVLIDGHEYVAEDTGGAVDGKHIDILVSTHAEALQKGTRHNVPVYNIKYDGVSMMEEGEWSGWTEDNREWVMAIYEQDWTELYCGIPNVTDVVGTETDLSGVKFVNGSRPGHQSIVNIALSQEGQVGGRPYWSWYGWDSRVEWCACFVSWCANKDGVLNTKIPKFALCSDGVDWFVKHGQWAKRGDTTPVAGDIIFFSWNSNSKIDHVGIVIGSDGTNVYTIEGNSRDKCRVKSYPLNSPVIYGYGLPNY